MHDDPKYLEREIILVGRWRASLRAYDSCSMTERMRDHRKRFETETHESRTQRYPVLSSMKRDSDTPTSKVWRFDGA